MAARLNRTSFLLCYLVTVFVDLHHHVVSAGRYRRAVTDTASAAAFLTELGYTDDSPGKLAPASTDLKKAIRLYQEIWKLQVTGSLDPPTLAMMNLPRCGNNDTDLTTAYQQSKVNRKKRYLIKNPSYYWSHHSLTYKITGYTPDLTNSAVDATITNAFKFWADVTSLSFTPTTGNEDIKIFFASFSHGDGSPFDGSSGTLAHAYYPNKAISPNDPNAIHGDAHFDESELWDVNNAVGGIDLLAVAVHEFGHSIGLGHSNVGGAIMYPTYSGYTPGLTLAADDIAGAQVLYPPPPPTTTAATSATSSATTAATTTVTAAATTAATTTVTAAATTAATAAATTIATTATTTAVTTAATTDSSKAATTAATAAATTIVTTAATAAVTTAATTDSSTAATTAATTASATATTTTAGTVASTATTVTLTTASPPTACQITTFDAVTTTRDRKTFFFAGDYYYEVNSTQSQQAKLISGSWQGAPSSLDAAVTTHDGFTLLFKGSLFYIYYGQTPADPYEFPILTFFNNWSTIEAAWLWPTDNHLFSTNGLQYSRYNHGQAAVDSYYPRVITAYWSGAPASLDAADTYTDGNVYFFKGTTFSKFDVAADVVTSTNINIGQHWFGCP